VPPSRVGNRELALSGRSAEAVKEGERALALALAAEDRTLISYIRHRLARIYYMMFMMFAGRPEQVLDQLEVALTEHSSVITAGRLRIDPTFSPARGAASGQLRQ
jgi:hypothetical protein